MQRVFLVRKYLGKERRFKCMLLGRRVDIYYNAKRLDARDVMTCFTDEHPILELFDATWVPSVGFEPPIRRQSRSWPYWFRYRVLTLEALCDPD